MIKDNQVSYFLSGSTWSGAIASGVGALTVSEWMALGGFLLAVAGFFVNLWHKHKMIKMARTRLHLEFPEAKSADIGDD